jgi:hypothetical protein
MSVICFVNAKATTIMPVTPPTQQALQAHLLRLLRYAFV